MTTANAPIRRYLTLAEAADITRLSERTLRRAIAAGELRAHHVGRRVRIEVDELHRWMAADGAPATSTSGGRLAT